MTNTEHRAQSLLGAPAGRQLCWDIVNESVRRTMGDQVELLARSYNLSHVELAIATLAEMSEDDLITIVASIVEDANYWEAPGDLHALLASRAMIDQLQPVATSLTGLDSLDWWWSPMAVDDQYFVEFLDSRDGGQGTGVGAAKAWSQGVEAWKTATVDEEVKASAMRPTDPAKNWSGRWWSTPLAPGIRDSTRRFNGVPLGMVLVEDGESRNRAVSRQLLAKEGSNHYEVVSLDAYRSLVEQFPLDVTSSRKHDWFRFSGVRGPWLIPDWQQVAQHYDGVHLSLGAYLSCAGVPIRVDSGWSLLTGWNPDQTFWLTESTRIAAPQFWVRSPNASSGWRSEPFEQLGSSLIP